MTAPSDDTATDFHAVIAALRAERDALAQALTRRNSEYGERIEHQSATIDVLKAMSASLGDAQPVFELIVHRALYLCNGASVGLFEYDGKRVYRRAASGGDEIANQRFAAMFPMVPTRRLLGARAILDRQIVHVRDMDAEPDLFQAARPAGGKSLLAIPLLRGGEAIGALVLNAEEPGGFSDSQIELLKTFAEQAVIAITSAETYRALQERTAALAQRNTEYGERIEHQSATIDVLKAMSASPGDARPIFQKIVERARELCGADQAATTLLDGDMLHLQAEAGMSEEVGKVYAAQFPRPVNTDSVLGRSILAREAVQVPDLLVDPQHFVRTTGPLDARAIAAVPLMRDGVPIGGLSLGRHEPGEFSTAQMELLRTFAEQAVIAITSAETYRALQTRTSDLQETLEYQTATSDVLKVISRSTFDLQPVLDTVAETAVRLCDADQAAIFRHEGGLIRLVTNFGFPPEYEAHLKGLGTYAFDPYPQNVTTRAIREGRTVHINDVALIPGYAEEAITLGKQRTSLGVPLLREGEAIGVIVLARRRVEPFADRQIELVSTFADQAVIAIENTRLLTEQREALEQQTATAELLQIINSSPGDPTPVFDAMLHKALRLCGAAFGALRTFDGEALHQVASRNLPLQYAEYWNREVRLGPTNTVLAAAVLEQRIVQIEDMAADESYRAGSSDIAIAGVELGGVRTLVHVPLIKDSATLGVLTVFRQEVMAFSDKELALLQNFAAQAVIAMENARLLTEQREALEQQTATAEVLQVINGNPGDLTPVFDAILDKAHTLCGAVIGSLVLFDGTHFRAVATHGLPEQVASLMRHPVPPNSRTQELIDGMRFRQIEDIRAIGINGDYLIMRALVEHSDMRTVLFVPLRKDGALRGFISAYRPEVRAFSDKEIALLENFAAQAVIATENARLLTEQREALEQQTATAEVLQVINASLGDLVPVFDAMLNKALHLCDAAFGILWTHDGECGHAVAFRGVPTAFADYLKRAPHPIEPGGVHNRLLNGEPMVHIADAGEDQAYRSGNRLRGALVELGGARTVLAVPLRKDIAYLGHFVIYRREVRTFDDKQIALVQNFAAQAVIAMENARLLNEQREALEQQTATAEVLQVINASPGDLAPVFDAMLKRATRLCDAAFGLMAMYDGEKYDVVATHGVGPDLIGFLRDPPNPDPKSALGRIGHGQDLILLDDIANTDLYHKGDPRLRALVDIGGAHSYAAVALRKDRRLLGIIAAYRGHVRPFEPNRISLLQSFAAQAVIAIENARLITEQREALEQQTATAEVLGVINASPGDLTPVFDAMLERALRLCGAEFGSLANFDGEFVHHVADRGWPSALREFARRPFKPELGSALFRLARGEDIVHLADITDDDAYRSGVPSRRALADVGGARSAVWVALRKEDALLGMMMLYRTEVRAFSDKEIKLLENFAAQAVIAMENARLLTETREALEQQTATAGVLQVINASPGNLEPVFKAILNSAHTICGAEMGSLQIWDGTHSRAVATLGYPEEIDVALRQPTPPGRGQLDLIAGSSVFHRPDVTAEPAQDEIALEFRRLTGVRTNLLVPLRKDGACLGFITANRREARPFTDKEIALLQSFAAQAVIAMDNARLITETREALEQQTATAEVLQTINASPGELKPVFDAMLERAMRLCGAAFGSFYTYDGERFHSAAQRGVPPAYAAHRAENPPFLRVDGSDRETLTETLFRTRKTVHVLDVKDREPYRRGDAIARAMVDLGGIRTWLSVPLVKGVAFLGYISIYRQEVRAFSSKEIALLENFAAQAVIAMENARLLTEQREALEQQTATAEVLQVINSSPGNLAPVFEAMLQRATRLCGAAVGSFYSYNGEAFQVLASTIGDTGQTIQPGPGVALWRIAHGESVVQIADIETEPAYQVDAVGQRRTRLAKTRTALAVALRKDETLVGAITTGRAEVRPFSDKEIALLQNFASQAVIAMENARLLTEQREALEQQIATAEVLQVINASPGDLVPVFEAILDKAHGLCGAVVGSLLIYDGERFHAEATHGQPEEISAILRRPFRPNIFLRRLVLGEHLVHIPDFKAALVQEDHELTQSTISLTDNRTSLWVPLRKDGRLLGCISAFRPEVRPFSEREIALLENFAAQAVVAMENARLLNEVRQRQEELRITFENMGDGVALFDETRHLVASNQRFQHMLDVPDDVIASRPTFSDYIRYLADHGEYGPDPEDHAQQLLALGSQPRTFERTRPNGRIIEIRVNPVPGGGFVVIYTDITERKRNEEEIRAARDAAEEASRTIEAAYRDLKAAQANLIQAEKMASLGQLTAGIAHEIKNPLNFVNNFAALSVDLLGELKEAIAPAEPVLSEKQRAEVEDVSAMLTSNLEKITEHGRRADGIVKAMLEHSRGSSGERRMVDLNALIDEALNLAYHGARAQDQSFNITLERDFAEGFAPIELAPQDMTRVFLNLFSNGFYAATRRARNSSDAGFTPTLTVTTRDMGDAIEVRVRDNGIGISADIRDKLFQPFFTTKPTGEGTGLGLSISYDIVTQQHGGSIAVDSKVGEYSEFTIRLPRKP